MGHTLKGLLEERKEEENRGITFIFSDTQEVFISYKELYYAASNLLYDLQRQGFKPGDEVVFQITDNQKFVYSFWACQLGGMIPVPVTTGDNDEHKRKLFTIWNILLNPRIIATSDFLKGLEVFAAEHDLTEKYNELISKLYCYDEITPSVNKGHEYEQKVDDLAFIQFSSGSTGDPKGVMITHLNVFTNISAAAEWMKMSEKDVCLNWMPLTHDMGLIGTHLKSIYLNIDQYNIHTNLFIRRPQLWMKKASEHKATLLYSPNFGYKYFLKYFKDKGDLLWDLSAVRMFYNGAEPISLELCEEFLTKLAPYGLQKNTMHTVYGLAEGTIAVTFPPLNADIKKHVLKRNYLNTGDRIQPADAEDKQAVVFADEGYPLRNCYVRICSEDGQDIGENRIGYIHIRGGSVTGGYYNNPEETQKVIDKDGWLNTNDLGFMQDGRLTITGRAKDIIFVNGQNYYSHDIERVTEECDCAEMGKVVAIGVFNEQSNKDELVIFLLFKGTVNKFIPYIKEIKDHIFQRIGIYVDHVIPVKKIDKTTSGKVQRFKFRENYASGAYIGILQEIEELSLDLWDNREIIMPATETEEALLAIWKEVFERDVISTEDDFFSLGGDSLRITQMISRIQESFQLEIEYNQLFMHTTVKSQAELIENDSNQEIKVQNTAIQKYNKKDYPLSYAQQRMWFLDHMNHGSPQYNLCEGILLEGNLDIGVLEQSLNLIAKRHLILKMTFSQEKGIPIQIYREDCHIKITDSDFTSLPEEDKQKAGVEFAQKIAKTPFDLQTGPLLKAHVLKLKKDSFLLILCTHHILFDGWSLGIVIKELMENYEALQKDAAFTVDEAEYQYVDYTNWQTEQVTQGNYKEQVSYWKNTLPSAFSQINLPFDKARPAVMTFSGETISSTISKETAEKVKIYARKTKTTPFMVLLSVFQLLLYRYSLDQEFVIGTSAANRNRKETEHIPGYFTNNLVLRTSIQEDSQFDAFLQDTKKTLLSALENQDVPFDKLVEELNVPRDMSMNPIFQIMFTMQNTKLPDLAFGNIKGSYSPVDTGNARFDLAVDIHESDDGFQFLYEYNTDLFYRETITYLAANYNQTLSNVLDNPHVLLNEVDILAQKEKEELLFAQKNNFKEFEKRKGIVGLFEEHVKADPDKIAVICGESSVTYAELDQKAARLSAALVKKGIGRDSIVAIYLDRTIELLAAILGIYKAGGAYLPMDPIFPPSRLSYMIQDAKVQFVISQETMLAAMPESDAEIILFDEIMKAVPQELSACSCEQNGSDLAYVLYTSGSTGNPKGVLIEQGALINFLQSMEEIIGIQKQDKWLAVTTISFDISILELLLPMISGSTVVIAKREDVFDGNRLLELIKEEAVTIMQATPATWKLMLEAGFSKNETLKILCGGEALPKLLADRLVEKGSILLNLYGPTETTIWSTCKAYSGHADKITIGKPIANTSVYVLDQKLMPVPIGVPGELYIGGAGLARGYFHQEKLTNEKFIRNPFYGENDPSLRIYRTGDIVKYLHNGELEYLQRMDNQVKIRGFRIELEEIQTLLSRHPFVKECVVAAKDAKQNEKMIAAYMILRDGIEKADVKPEEVRIFLKEKLPEYMIPTAFIVMDAFPLTLNKKVDIKALPDPSESKIVITKEYEAATNEMEKSLIAIWKEVLNIPQVGIKDNFFDLGGYSMLLTQVRSKIAEMTGREIPIIELFKYPTIESLAGYLSGDTEAANENEAVDRKPMHHEGSNDIAVVGMSGRFPGAGNLAEFWENLCSGKESIVRFDKQEAVKNGASKADVQKAEYVGAWGALGDIDKFDGKFFGYNPKEAIVLDPQQRIFLEEVWKAFENAGYNPDDYAGDIGLYAGVGMNTYMEQLEGAGYRGSLANDYQVMTSNDKDFLSTRVSYKLNLTGPSVTVQTACSSSLVALHQACQSLKNGECDMAAAGGVSIRMPEKKGYLYQEGMILSKDGHCRAFDKDAGGTVGGNGAGVVILKRYEDALEDRDEILAVIKGSAINNDGSRKIGYTAPSVQGQTKAIQSALSQSGLNAGQISYIETHGTGTKLGDPIEIEALTKAYKSEVKEVQYCGIGSVKTNIGHLDAAAGITGFIKTVLSIKNRKLLPSLHYQEGNTEINFADSPFYVNTELKDYKKEEPYCAGVSSFGIGGTNAHVIVQEAPGRSQTENLSKGQKSYLIPLSAASKSALQKKCEELKTYLIQDQDIDIADMAYTLSIGRKEFEYRYCFTAGKISEVIDGLTIFLSDSAHNNHKESSSDELQKAADTWNKGGKVEWKKLFLNESPRRIPLPVYPFEKVSYWPKPVKNPVKEISALEEGEKTYTDFFYTPVWEQSTENLIKADNNKTTVIFTDSNHPFVDQLIQKIKENSKSVYQYGLNDDKSFSEILKELKDDLIILPIFGFDSVYGQEEISYEEEIKTGEESFFTLLRIAKAIGTAGYSKSVTMKVLTNGMHKVLGEKRQRIGLACILGAIKVIPMEYPTVQCAGIDLESSIEQETDTSYSLEQLLLEIASKSVENMIAYRGETRFVQTYKKIELSGSQPVFLETVSEDVYLITGGLGGIGLQIAEEMMNHGRPALIFLQRSAFVAEEEWESYLQSPEAEQGISEKIRKLQILKQNGMDVRVVHGDVTKIEEVASVRQWILEQFGKITGIIHAAGTPGGGMIQMKEQEEVKRVFAAKVKGTAVLYQVFQADSLKNIILFSSLNAVTGGFGQSDYSGANAYMDAFAKSFDKKNGIRVVSIDWERWPGVGMAKELPSKAKVTEHILLGRQIIKEGGKWVFYRAFDPNLDWALSEHHVFGIPTVAGTTYLEMARAAFLQIKQDGQTVIKDVVFLSPMAVPFGQKCDVITILTQKEEEYEFVIASRITEQAEKGWVEHAKGKITSADENTVSEAVNESLIKIKEKKYDNTYQADDLWNQYDSAFIYFGNRWKSLQWLSVCEQDALAKIKLPEEFSRDLDHVKLHPALFDVATGALRFVSGGNYLPFTYQAITIRKPLEAELYTHLKFQHSFEGKHDFITCDITIYNSVGEVLLEIRNFSMRLVENEEKLNAKENKENARIQEQYNRVWSVAEQNVQKESNILTQGLTSEEGKNLFTHILRYCHLPQIIISKKDVNTAIAQADYLKKLTSQGETENDQTEQEMHERPELNNAYAECRNEAEEKVKNIWQPLIGISGIGIHDEFFELGGDSLLLIQLHTKLKESFQKDFPVVDLYKYNTIAKQAKLLSEESAEDQKPTFEQVNDRVNTQRSRMQQRRNQSQRRRGENTNEQL